MFKLKNQFKIISIILFICLGLLFMVNNNHQVMAMNNYDLNNPNSINNKINDLYLERKELVAQILSFSIYNLDISHIQEKIYHLDQKIKSLYQRLSIINILQEINKQIWDYSYQRNQIVLKIFCLSFEEETIEELHNNHQKIIQKIHNLRQKYIHLQCKLNEFN
jgi:hypothetical protein